MYSSDDDYLLPMSAYMTSSVDDYLLTTDERYSVIVYLTHVSYSEDHANHIMLCSIIIRIVSSLQSVHHAVARLCTCISSYVLLHTMHATVRAELHTYPITVSYP